MNIKEGLREAWSIYRSRWLAFSLLAILPIIIVSSVAVFSLASLLLKGLNLASLNLASLPISLIEEAIGVIIVLWVVSDITENAGLLLALDPKKDLESAFNKALELLPSRMGADVIAAVLGLLIVILLALADLSLMPLGAVGLVLAVIIDAVVIVLYLLAIFAYKYYIVKGERAWDSIKKSFDLFLSHPGALFVIALVILVLILVIAGVAGIIGGSVLATFLAIVYGPWLSWIYYTRTIENLEGPSVRRRTRRAARRAP